MYTIYVLQDNNEKQYVGMTNNLERRLKEHRSKKTRTTRSMNEIRVVYTEKVADRQQARQREKYLKSAAGRRFHKTLTKGS